MNKYLALIFILLTPLLLSGQSAVSVGAGSSIIIGTGCDITAGSKSGNIAGMGTFNGLHLGAYLEICKPTNVLPTSATLNATINPFGSESTYYFSYGTDPDNLVNNTAARSAGSGSSSLAVSEDISGLTENTLYYCKITATDAAGNSNSAATYFFSNNSITRSGLALWLRADQGITSSANNISRWKDLSGNNNDATQSSASNQPLLVGAAMNGNAAARFNGSGSKLLLPTAANIGIQNNPYEVFIVARSGSSNIQFLLAGGTLEQFEYHLNGASGARFIPRTSAYLDELTSGYYTDGKPHVFSARASSSGGAVLVDGIDGGTSDANIISSNAGALLIGVRSDGSYYFNGDMAEVILYNATLGSSDRNAVEHYLAGRYGITSGALPVELISFTASFTDGNIILNWQTATEMNNSGFEIERKVKSGNWEKIGYVSGSGNSNSPKQYSYTDKNAEGDYYIFRLKQIDTDGSHEYSKEIEVISNKPKEFTLAQNFPNPFNPSTLINYQLPEASQVTLIVFDIIGREVAALINARQEAGRYKVPFDASKLTTGIYIAKLTAGKYTKSIKMSLIK